ncbi:MAG: hypothetical protein WBE26_20060 [Phycisphaerae bacterium]
MRSTQNLETIADSPPTNRRRKYVINPAFQWKYIVTSALVIFLISSLMSLVLYGLLHRQARLRFMSPETYTAEVTLVILLFAVGFATVTAVGVGLWCVIVTHRICGPLFVLERHLLELTRGRFPKLRPLRRKDEFKELYRVFSKAVDSLKTRKQTDLAALTDSLETAKSAIGSDDETRQNALESLVRQIESLRRAAAEALGDETSDAPTRPATASQPTPRTAVTVP